MKRCVFCMRKDKHAHNCTQPGIPLDKINDAKLPLGERKQENRLKSQAKSIISSLISAVREF